MWFFNSDWEYHCCASTGDEAALEELDPDSYDLTIAGERGWGEDIDDDGFWHGQRNDFSSGARHLLSTAAQAAAAKHSAVHAAAVKHAAHKEASRARVGVTPPESVPGQASSSSGATQFAPSGVSLPRMPKKPPVCSVPPRMRFCKNINYAVYRPDEDHTFAELDFDSHAVFKKIVPHMRISERHFELPVIHQCRSNFRKFLCLRNFPRCCHVGLCSKYGDPDRYCCIPPAHTDKQTQRHTERDRERERERERERHTHTHTHTQNMIQLAV